MAHVSVENVLGGAHTETMKAWKHEGMGRGPSSALQLTQLVNGASGGARWAEKDKAQKAWGTAVMSPHFSPLPLASTCWVPKH